MDKQSYDFKVNHMVKDQGQRSMSTMSYSRPNHMVEQNGWRTTCLTIWLKEMGEKPHDFKANHMVQGQPWAIVGPFY